MKILSVNAGSSSLKFSLIELPKEKVLISGNFEKIGLEGSFYSYKINERKTKKGATLNNHKDAINLLISELIDNDVIKSLNDIDGIGHRVVQGGHYFDKSEIATEDVIAKVESLCDLAPLHNPAHIMGIKAFKEVLPNVPMACVFDTAFHQTMSEEYFMYPLPYKWYEKHNVRKYGFHGTSHKYIDKTISEHLKKENLKVISCHIGQGASICAIDNHKVIDTSMGFTPLAGIMMGTRCGDIDPSIIPYIMEKENITINEMINILNKESGLLGLSELSNDARDVEEAVDNGDEKCIIAFEKMCRTIANYIAMYNNTLNGADVICFTAGLGERSMMMRERVIAKLLSLGLTLNKEVNNKVFGNFGLISTDTSKIPVYVVPTDEELMIAIDTYNLLGNK